jgi:peptidoglycan/LPS O-acetylase OafA/YrhL
MATGRGKAVTTTKLVNAQTVSVEHRPSSAERPGRLPGLDGLRGLAAVAVMLFHYTVWLAQLSRTSHQPYGSVLWFPYGIFGVELFFIISGFVIFMTLDRRPTLADFGLARFARLYPAFFVCMLATILLIGEPINSAKVLANLTMVPAAFGQSHLDGSYWSLLYELGFYLLAAVACIICRCRRPELPCVVWLLAEFVVRAVFHGVPLGPLMTATQTSFAHLFVIGIMLYRLRARQATPLTLPLLLLSVAMALYGPSSGIGPMPKVEYVGIIAGLSILVWLATTRFGLLLGVGPLRFLGRISYPLYLVHQAAGFVLLDRLHALGLHQNLSVAITMTAAVVLAWTISTTIERPAQRWLRARFVTWRDRSVRPAVAGNGVVTAAAGFISPRVRPTRSAAQQTPGI